MNTNTLKTFARDARVKLLDLVGRKIEFVLTHDTAELRGKQEQIGKLRREIERHGKEQVIERIAYIWFNRFMALRFMDANEYNSPKVVSPIPSGTIPEILQEAKAGHIDESLQIDRQRVNDLLDGKTPSADPQTDAYKLLLVASCNALNAVMPFMFERIADYTELLMPDDLLSDYSIVTDIRTGMSDENCKQVELIGWMYQFYISERKDKVFEDLATNKKITPENIPAATQLFTPNWIVRYLVENSLGRLWMLNRPASKLIDKMEFYIKPTEPEKDFLKIPSPEEIKLCDPACGSGHMLVYAFALLYLIYEEEGYDPTEIPGKILVNNLYGIEIDERAGELAAFALTMVAREKYRRFFKKPIQPNICVLNKIDLSSAKDPKSAKNDLFSNVKWEDNGWEKILDEICKSGIPRIDLLHDIGLFAEADNLGSLVQPSLSSAQLKRTIKTTSILHETHEQDAFVNALTEGVLTALRQSEYLSKRYHVVVANPPYMGRQGMNERLKAFVKENFPNTASDLFSAFIERIMVLVNEGGYIGLMTPFTWMFLSSYEALRTRILNDYSIVTLVRPEYHAFFDSAYVPICGFVLSASPGQDLNGIYIDLQQFYGADLQHVKTLEAIRNPFCGWLYECNTSELKKIPGIPISYWVNPTIRKLFSSEEKISASCDIRKGLSTGNDATFVRMWYEVSHHKIKLPGFQKDPKMRWWPLNKGGPYRRWYGNRLHVINWGEDGKDLRNYEGSVIRNPSYYEKEMISWSMISSSFLGVRYYGEGFIFEGAGPSLFASIKKWEILGFLESKLASEFVNILNPTLNINIANIGDLPLVQGISPSKCEDITKQCIDYAKADWDSYEMSWDFKGSPLLQSYVMQSDLKSTYLNLRTHGQQMVDEMVRLEETNNNLFISAYDLVGKRTPEVPLTEITLNCNANYRYGNDKTSTELDRLFLCDTMKEYISYSVGCMFARYSLDKPGLILANQGDIIVDLLKQIKKPSFMPDEDNIIPIQDEEYFTDDIVTRFKDFLRVTFGTKNYEVNLAFLEEALGKELRKYFVNDFYKDHIKRYRKRPIYWMFSSPKRSFNVLIYVHQYRPDTISTILNDYLRAFIGKLETKKTSLNSVVISESASPRERTRATKEMDSIESKLKELKAYEKTLHDYAARKIEIDLDDGVKVNYLKFKEILAPIPGLDKDEE